MNKKEFISMLSNLVSNETVQRNMAEINNLREKYYYAVEVAIQYGYDLPEAIEFAKNTFDITVKSALGPRQIIEIQNSINDADLSDEVAQLLSVATVASYSTLITTTGINAANAGVKMKNILLKLNTVFPMMNFAQIVNAIKMKKLSMMGYMHLFGIEYAAFIKLLVENYGKYQELEVPLN